MRKNLQAIVLLKNFATGILAPVFTLALLAHGASLQSLSLFIGAYSFTVIAAEFPTGLFADLYGRKTSFSISVLLSFCCYGLLLFSQSSAMLLAALVLNGLGRAFPSGSIDALAIDEAGDDATLVKVTARLSMLESVGLSVGALTGGLLSGIGTGYRGNLGANLILCLLLLTLTQCTVHEKPRRLAHTSVIGSQETTALATECRPNLGVLVKQSMEFLAQPGLVLMLFAFAMLTGFAMFTVETYWQPALADYSAPAWLFGAVSFAGFGSVIVGSKLAEKLLMRSAHTGFQLLLSLKALLGCALLLLMPAGSAGVFTGIYMLTYLLLGGGGVVENTLLNREASASQRASILSLFSFVMQIGGLFASLIAWLVSANGDFRLLWLLAGGLLIASTVILGLLRLGTGKRLTAAMDATVAKDHKTTKQST